MKERGDFERKLWGNYDFDAPDPVLDRVKQRLGKEKPIILDSPLDEPLGRIVISEPAGEIHLSRGPLSLKFTYQPVGSEHTEAFQYIDPTNMAGWREVTTLHFANQDTGTAIELDNIRPSDTHLFFRADGIHRENSYYLNQYKVIETSRDLAQPSTICILLHEVGHGFTAHKMSHVSADVYKAAYQRTSEGRSLSPEMMEVVIKSEAYAWSFAAKQLRYLLTDKPNNPLTRQNLNAFIYQRLSSYSAEIREKIEEKLIKDTESIMEGYR